MIEATQAELELSCYTGSAEAGFTTREGWHSTVLSLPPAVHLTWKAMHAEEFLMV